MRKGPDQGGELREGFVEETSPKLRQEESIRLSWGGSGGRSEGLGASKPGSFLLSYNFLSSWDLAEVRGRSGNLSSDCAEGVRAGQRCTEVRGAVEALAARRMVTGQVEGGARSGGGLGTTEESGS